MADASHSFHVADYCVFALTLTVSLAIGIFYALSGNRQRTTSEYFVGGGTMRWVPVLMSLLVTFQSSILMLGYPAEAYVYGIQMIVGSFGYLISNMVSAYISVPLFHPLEITSIFEYLELRYDSKAIHLLGTFLGVMATLLYMGVVLYGPALALDAVTGFPQLWSILLVGLGSTIYTSIGGMKAVVWTDVFQSVIMYSGMMALLIKGTLVAGGAGAVWNIAKEGGRLNFFNFDPDPTVRHTFWTVFGGTLINGFFLGFQQPSLLRMKSQKTVQDARRILLLASPAFMVVFWLAMYQGIVAYAYYVTIGCDPLESGSISNPNQIVVDMVMRVFKSLPGMPGVYVAALFSASLSTLSSGLSSISSNVWQDFIKPYIGPTSELKATVIAKVTVAVSGALACTVSVLISAIGGNLNQIALSVLAAFGSPKMGLFLLSSICPWANKWGAMTGTVTSLLVSCYISFGSGFTRLKRPSFKLQPAPTYGCPTLANITSLPDATASYGVYNVTGLDWTTGHPAAAAVMNATLTPLLTTPASTDDAPEAVGLQKLLLMSYQWYGPFAILVVFVVGSIVSLITGANRKQPVDPKYLIPLFDRLCPWLPKGVRDFLQCGVDHSDVQFDKEEGTRPGMEVHIPEEYENAKVNGDRENPGLLLSSTEGITRPAD